MGVPGRARVEILYFIGCPAYRRARERTIRILEEYKLPANTLTMTRVRSEREAVQRAFHGSPTIRVNDMDIDPAGTLRYERPGLYSREYMHDGKREDIPPEGLIRDAIRTAIRGKGP